MFEKLREGFNKARYLSKDLSEKGHPYGLLLLSSSNMASVNINVNPDIISCVGGSVLSCLGLLDLDNYGSLSISSASSLWSSSYGFSTVHWTNAAQLTEQTMHATVFLPGLSTYSDLSIRTDKLSVSEKGISLESVAAKAISYKGIKPFEVKDEEGNKISTVNTDDKLLLLHVNRKADLYRSLSPLERVKRIKKSLLSICRILEEPDTMPIDGINREMLKEFSKAPILGVSHLVQLVNRYTEIPTWSTEDLPGVLRWAHTMDSNLVSRLFSGKRSVSPDDVRVVFITPSVRHQLLLA